uniref:Uncharacterized mitochondrial protein AtMg00810-like n=1 Tax=Tanacetum cinerariifolium TaxID=118510 RepID=A0A6L2LHS4_TANCI|nr:uncharacterized mitochondrial protein AtMg00810-like [Tanacetum cinerariifolium]
MMQPQKRRNDVKARTTLLLALPDEHQLRFSKYKTAQELWDAILKTFGGNEATKTTKKNQLKQQYGNFKAEGKETLEQTFNKLQAIVSHLEFINVEIEQDDLNQKFLTSLAPEWLMYMIVWRNRSDIDTMSLDDVYNHLKVYEPEVKKKSESNSQNMPFISSAKNSSRNGEVNTTSIPTTSTQVFYASANVAAVSISLDTACAYIASQSTENHALVADEETPTEFALMAKSSYDSEVFDNSICSKSCKKNTDSLNSKITELSEKLCDTKTSLYHYKLGLSKVEARLVEFKNQEIKLCEKIRGLEFKVEFKSNRNECLTNELEMLKKEKEGLDSKLTGFQSASKDLDTFIGSQRPDKNKEGLGYSVVPPPAQGNFQNIIDDKGYWDSGCSRHMTGNISYLSDYEPYDGGYVSFGQGGCKIIGKGTIKTDESMLWHRRLGHLNFKTMNRFTWTFFLKTKDESSGILRNFITEIENLKDLKLKIIRCNNEGEFRNKDMNDLCSRKGIKREFSNARTPQQNGVPERRNKTLIETARTMLADAKLPIIFWAEAVNTACYVQNRVLVTKSKNKISYELFNGKTYAIGFLKPFGCHVMILNTLDHLGKFETKGDEENKLIEKGAGPNWLFDIDTLTNSMNYVPVVSAGTTSTNFSGTKEAASQDVKKNVSSLRYIALPNWFHEAHLETSTSNAQDACKADAPESSRNSNPIATSTNSPADQMETLTVETSIPTVSSPVPTACLDDSLQLSSDTRLISKRVTSQDDTPSLDNILTLSSRFEDILRVTTNTDDSNKVEADLGNVEYNISASPTATFRIHKDHLKSQIIGHVDNPVQTKTKSKEIDIIHQKTDPALLQFCLFLCFLSQEEPKKIFDALKDPSWDSKFPARVYKVEKAMYGLHQAPRTRYGTFSKYLLTNGFQRGTIDQTLFIRKHIGDFRHVQVYVDDISFGSSNPQLCREFEALMHEKFQMSAMGKLNFFLGLQVLQKKDGIFLSQDKYIGDILRKFRYSDVRSANTPMDKENPWGKDRTGKNVDLYLYRSMIGSLMYLTASRLDIMFAVCACARHQVTPKECHLHAVKRFLDTQKVISN